MFTLDPRLLVVPALVAPALAVAAPALAQDQTLKVGSPIPALTVNWVQGDVDSLTDATKTYVIEFWATWCGPCMKSIPHLNELYAKNRARGLVIVGISDESMSTVKPWVAKKGSGMAYPVAVDSEKKTNEAWMKAANQNGLPCAFVCREGKVQWIGNPLDPNFDKVVAASLNGRYNPSLAKKGDPIFRAARDAVRVKNFQDAYRHYDSLLEIDGKFFGDAAVLKYKTMLVDAKDSAGAADWGSKVTGEWMTDPVTIRELADTILNDGDIQDRDYSLALTAAQVLAGNFPSASNEALVAEVYARKGDFAKASEKQYEAWMKADPADKADFKRVLDTYKKSAAKAGLAKP